MEKTTGLFTPTQEGLITSALFDLVNRKRKIPRFVKFIVRIIIKKIDNKKLDNLPVHWKEALLPIVDSAFKKDFATLKKQVALVMNNQIDIPNISEQTEQIMFEMFVKIASLAIVKYVQKNQTN